MSDKYLLALNAHPKIGSQIIKKALSVFSNSTEKLWQAKHHSLKKVLGEKIADLIKEAQDKYDPDYELEKLQKLNIGYISFLDKPYPKILKEIPDNPALIYLKGDIEAINKPSIAFVGSRKYSDYGKRVCSKIISSMSDTDISIISGLALGIDAVAHQQALNSKLTTVAVLGCGLDIIYPSSNYLLAEKIIKEGGAIISEYPPNTLPKKQHFPARNRIIAGLSLGTVVVEAAVKSGALITAYLALDYNRAVFAVPGDIDRESSRGCNLLIQKGAKAVINVEDIFSELNIDQKIQQIVLRQDLPENETEVEILSIIKDNKKHVDEIIKASKHNIAEIAGALTTLELKGSLENAGGGYWIKVN